MDALEKVRLPRRDNAKHSAYCNAHYAEGKTHCDHNCPAAHLKRAAANELYDALERLLHDTGYGVLAAGGDAAEQAERALALARGEQP